MFCTRKLQFFGIVHCCTPEDPFFSCLPIRFGTCSCSHCLRVVHCACWFVGFSSAMHSVQCSLSCQHQSSCCLLVLRCVFVVMSTSIFSAFCTSTMLLAGSSFLVCKVCVCCHANIIFSAFFVCNVCCHVNINLAGSSFLVCKVCVCCHINIDLQRFLCVHCAACWFFVPRLQSVCSLSCQLSLSSLR